MPELKSNKVEVEQKPLEEVKPAEAKITSKANDTFVSPQETNPSNWNVSENGDKIVATNYSTGRVFDGSIAEFSNKLRGK
jgi:hypothetical protein